jgi:hypothetical protein
MRKSYSWTPVNDISFNHIGGGVNLSKKERVKDKKTKPDELVVLWMSGDREVALKMAFMYTLNSKRFKWGWKNVTLVVWGPSARLLTEDKELQEHIYDMKERGVKLLACKKCSDLYGVSDALRQLGIEVKYMGKPLTDYLRDDNVRVITI